MSNAELENERMRLAACGVAALSNTPETVADRITPDNPYWSASYQDVCNAVDREMKLRAQLARQARAIEVLRAGLKCNTSFHRLGGIDDCDPCSAIAEAEKILGE